MSQALLIPEGLTLKECERGTPRGRPLPFIPNDTESTEGRPRVTITISKGMEEKILSFDGTQPEEFVGHLEKFWGLVRKKYLKVKWGVQLTKIKEVQELVDSHRLLAPDVDIELEEASEEEGAADAPR